MESQFSGAEGLGLQPDYNKTLSQVFSKQFCLGFSEFFKIACKGLILMLSWNIQCLWYFVT